MTRRSQRGSGLLLAIIVVLVLTVIAVGVLRFGARELAGTTAGKNAEALTACADAGRTLLLAQFRATGVAPMQLEPLGVTLATDVRAIGGHINETQVQVQQVQVLPAGSLGSERKNTRDITNIAFPSLAPLGGKPYRIMVHCDDHGRQLEVEFGVRFGL